MKALEMNQMEQIEGGGCVDCGPAMIFGAMLFGLVGTTLVGLGPNCYDLLDAGVCNSGGASGSW